MHVGCPGIRRVALSTAAIFLVAAAIVLPQAQEVNARRPTIRQADHLVIETRNARELFDLFTGTLQLPVAWPFVDSPSFTGGGFGTGNFSAELVQTADRRGRALYASLALEPYSLPDCVQELQGRGISSNPPELHVGTLPDKTQGLLWTTVVLTDLSRPGMGVFLYGYSPKYLNIHVRRNQMAGELALRRGGPLGITSVRELVITTTDLKAEIGRWQKLLFPVRQTSPGTWNPGNGPALRLTAGKTNRIERMIFGVRSLEQARAWLKQNQMLGTGTATEIGMNPARVQGLGMRFREQ